MTLLEKYKKALIISDCRKDLKCHYKAIEKKIGQLKDPSYEPTMLDEVWVYYFLN